MDSIKLQADSRQAAASAEAEVKTIGNENYVRVILSHRELLQVWAALTGWARYWENGMQDKEMDFTRKIADKVWDWIEQSNSHGTPV